MSLMKPFFCTLSLITIAALPSFVRNDFDIIYVAQPNNLVLALYRSVCISSSGSILKGLFISCDVTRSYKL